MKLNYHVIAFISCLLLLCSCARQPAPPLTEEEEITAQAPADEASDASSPEAGGEEAAPEEAEKENLPSWASLGFTLDGQSLTVPFSFSEIADTWSIDPESDRVTADQVLSPGERTADDIPLISETWNDMLISAGFVNLSDKDLPVSECSIWTLTLDATWTGEEERPELSLPEGITWGSSAEEIVSAYGEPSIEPFYSESLFYSSYTYNWDYIRDLDLVIYDEKGLTMFTAKTLE